MCMARPSSKAQKEEKIAAEIARLKEQFSDISEDKQKVAENLLKRVAFMTITLEILEDDINTKGPTYKFEQGSQKMFVENPSQKSYNTMINRYTAAYDKLFNLLAKEGPEVEEDDGFETFVMKT